MASRPKISLPADQRTLEAFNSYYVSCLRSIAALRSKGAAPYSEAVCDALATITKRVDDGVIEADPLSEMKDVEPVFPWVSAQREKFSEDLESLWLYAAKERRVDLASAAPRVTTAMRQEREFRFFGLFVPLAAGCSESATVPVAAPTARAVRRAHDAAEKLFQATGTLLRDEYLKRALSLQELPLLRALNEVLPGLIETLGGLNVKSLYPVRNEDETGFARFVFVELSEMLLRCFGHANPRVLELLAGVREVDVPPFDEKWSRDRVADARKMIEAHELRRGVHDVRYSRRMWEEDFVRPLGDSFWLGENALTRLN